MTTQICTNCGGSFDAPDSRYVRCGPCAARPFALTAPPKDTTIYGRAAISNTQPQPERAPNQLQHKSEPSALGGQVERHEFKSSETGAFCLAKINGFEHCGQPRKAEVHAPAEPPQCEHSISLTEDYIGAESQCPIHGETVPALQTDSRFNPLRTDREAWLISDLAFLTRTKIDSGQYIELRDLAVRLLNQLRAPAPPSVEPVLAEISVDRRNELWRQAQVDGRTDDDLYGRLLAEESKHITTIPQSYWRALKATFPDSVAQEIEIVITISYEDRVGLQFSGATLAEAMQQVRDFKEEKNDG